MASNNTPNKNTKIKGKKPFILISNDDGIHAPGIKFLWKALQDFADLAICAPLNEKSGSSMAITSTRPLEIKEVAWEKGTQAWSVNGTPADCIKLAFSVVLPKKPDFVVTGINRGSNSGRTLLYSGTVGGVIEAAIRNIPGIAFSSENFTNPKYQLYEKYIHFIVQHFLKNPLPAGAFVNVTLPSLYTGKVKGVKMARQGKGYWIENPDKRVHPEGHSYYWLGAKWMAFEEEADSDITLLKKGYVTAVPLRVNELTDFKLLQHHKMLFEDIFEKVQDKKPEQEWV